jgi:Ras-related protein Rab-7A
MPIKRKQILKVIILGDSGVGKTSLMNRFVKNKFNMHYKATIGADFMTKDITIHDKSVTLQIWDTAGQERFQSIGVAFYRGADCCVLVYDVTNSKSFEQIDTWKAEFLRQTQQSNPESFPFLLVGNKIDSLTDEHLNLKSRIEEWCGNNIPHIETSAKEGTNVEEAFKLLASEGLKKEQERERELLDYSTRTVRLGPRDAANNSKTCTC